MGSTLLVFWGIAAVLLLAGVSLILAGGFTFLNQKKRTAGWVSTGGVVVDVVTEAITPGNIHAYPVIEFTPAGMSAVRFTSQVGHYPPDHRRDQRLAVKYNPNDLRQAVIDSPEQWFVPAGLAGLGLIALVLAGMIAAIVSGS